MVELFIDFILIIYLFIYLFLIDCSPRDNKNVFIDYISLMSFPLFLRIIV